ncbi:hypothetical protein [Desulfotomaculum copahuensis]|uniref:Uncharacterized protein n=1 Tax=Desulfotomaculum copahuensis TaxID=1838280 RepID=A0A1B7LDA0_9FIRM|nr:hypothetical protein [Desulfotomaculum copahuensis]OAT81085.1 hypothetical protein A6M21_11765 [Desulfotomaculum copahuensis]
MAWIESHQELARHPKTRKLARILGVSIPTVIGHLHLLWWWAMDYAQEGTLERYDDSDIADAAMWEGDPAQFLDALYTAGFIDQDEHGVFSIHDWHDYAGRLLEKRRADAERKRSTRHRPMDVQRTSIGCPTDGAGNLTVPNQTEHNQTVKIDTHAPGGASAQPQNPSDQPADQSGEQRKRAKTQKQEELFARFWAAYPKKRSKGQAEKAWAKLQPDEQLVETMLAAIERAKKSEEWRKENGRYIPYPATWLNAKGWEDEYTIAAEVNSNAQHRGCTPKPSAFGNAVQAKNRFAGLARDGGTGRVIGRQDSPNTGGNSQASGNPRESAGDNESHKVAAGVSMA